MWTLIITQFKYWNIPFVAAFVGWFTNWIAIQMTFYPIKPVGWPPFFGWVGIIPAKSEKMGRIATRSILSKLGNLTDVFEAMEPEKLAGHVLHHLDKQIETYVDSLMLEEDSTLWELTPQTAKSVIYSMVRRKLPETLARITAEIRDNIEEMIDLEWTVVSRVREDKTLINRIFLQVGSKEFQFIIQSGIYFGFALGILQAILWYLLQQFIQMTSSTDSTLWWFMPIGGAIVGYLTNWLALRIIFQPLKPRRIFFWTVQGLFLKRQAEVSEIWTEIVTKEILTVRHIMYSLFYGPRSERTKAVVRYHTRRTVDDVLGPTRLLAQGALGVRQYADLKNDAANTAIELSMSSFDDPVLNASRAAIVQSLLAQRMKELPPSEFQALLRPAFQEDEWKLILLGGILGFLTGLLQIVTFF